MFGFCNYLKSCFRRGQTRAAGHRPPVLRAIRRTQLFLENLEERLVLTIVFQPQLGVETQAQAGGTALTAQNVYVIYWGPNTFWTTAAVQKDSAAISQLLSSPYLTGTVQYGAGGAATLAGYTVDFDALPSSVNQVQIQNEVTRLIGESALPIAVNSNLYVVLTPPTEPYSFPGNVATGYNWVSNGKQLIWDGQTADVDQTLGISGQLADAFSDPGNQGYAVHPGSNYGFQVNQNPGQIADFEPHFYQYRMTNGVLVEPYWSKNDHAYIVPDGTAQEQFYVYPNFVAGGGAFTETYYLKIVGDQQSGNQITINTTSTDGLSITADGETATFDPGMILGIEVDGQGQLTVNDTSYSAARTITLKNDPDLPGWGDLNGVLPTKLAYQYSSTTNLSMLTSPVNGNVVNIQDTGSQTYIFGDGNFSSTINVGDGTVGAQNIKGTLYIANSATSNPTANITITDAADTGVRSTLVDTAPMQGASTTVTGLAPSTISLASGVANNLAITTSATAGNTLTVGTNPIGNAIQVGGTLSLVAPTIVASEADFVNAGVAIDLTGSLSSAGGFLDLNTPTVSLSGGTSPHTLVVTPTASAFQLTWNNTLVALNGVSTVLASGGAADSATLNDTAGSALFVGTPTYSSLQGSGFTETVSGYGKVQAVSSHGASDTANLATSTGSDNFQGTPTFSTVSGTGYSNTAVGFGVVHCWAEGPASTADLATSATGSDVLGGVPAYSFVQGSNYASYAIGFANVDGYAGGSGSIAYLGMSSGHDTFFGLPAYSAVTGVNYAVYAVGFARAQGYAGGPNSSAILATSAAGHDTYVGTPTYSVVQGATYLAYALGFANVAAYARGGNSVAFLSTSSGNDFFVGSAASSEATNGTSYNNFAIGFANVAATAGSSNSNAFFNDAPGTNTFSGSGNQALESGPGYNVSGTGFGAVALFSPNDGTDTSSTSALDYAFAKYGNWK